MDRPHKLALHCLDENSWITNNYDGRTINADKSIVLTTANMFGGTNLFMTIAFAIAGAFCIGACFIFLYKLWATNWTFGVNR
jgi:hypothetical protein